MLVIVKFFASCREQVGATQISIEIANGSDTGALLDLLVIKYPSLKNGINEVSIAVNKQYIREKIELHENDEVALIPPISGG